MHVGSSAEQLGCRGVWCGSFHGDRNEHVADVLLSLLRCRGGRMFAPNKTWRKWTAKTNNNERRVAVCSALAASAVPALLMARGHKISGVNEVPLVIANEIESITKTREALALLAAHKASEDVEHVKDSKKIRAGSGKMRNRRYVMRKGPLIIYANNNGVEQSFRNIPGVEVACVDRLNLLKLAPGGHMGRFIIWSQAAFEKLDSVFGSFTSKSDQKKNFVMPRCTMANADLARIINSDEIQSKVRAAKQGFAKPSQKRNPLKNLGAMLKLNPYVGQVKRAEAAAQKAAEANKKRLAPKAPTGVGKKAAAGKRVAKGKFQETLRAVPTTPCASFLQSYNAVEEINTTQKTV